MAVRPTFMFNGSPVRAAGVLLYTYNRGRRRTLFRDINGRYEDIGGKTDPLDNNFVDTAVREAVEETGGKLFCASHRKDKCALILRDLIETHCEIAYNAKSKYVLFKLPVHAGILVMPMKRFGLQEKTDWGILKHYYKWMGHVPRKLHPRLWGLL